MSGPNWKRPSVYVALCAAFVIVLFVVRGDLRVTTDPSGRGERQPEIVRNNLPPARAIEHVVISGRVVDALGFALAGAVVRDGAGSTRCSAAGSFELPTRRAPFTDLVIEAEGCGTGFLRTSVDAPGPLLVQLAPRSPWDCEPVGLPVAPALTGEGSVRDRDGRPVDGAYVTAAGSGLWSRTDEIGRYVLPLLDTTPTLLVHRPATADAPAFAARTKPLALPRARGMVPLPEIVVDGGGSIQGVLRGANGSPLAGMAVAIEGEGMTRICESGAGGLFRVTGLVPGDYRVRPLAWQGAVGVAREVELSGDTAACEVTLEPTRTAKVQVCGEEGTPVGKAYIASIFDGERRAVARADDDGWAEVTLADAADYEVRAADGLAALAVRRLDEQAMRLVVAAP
jgi:hypothetical protein